MAKRAPAKHNLPKQAANMVIMAEHQAFARGFDILFAGGLALADKVSRYFNGAGSEGAEYFSPALARFYERERKKLGIKVMQMAAWLWLERALRDGEMSAEQAAAEKRKLVFVAQFSPIHENTAAQPADSADYDTYFAQLPPAYRLLAQEVEYFVSRLPYMDKETAPAAARQQLRAPNPVTLQWQKLHRSFGRKK
ncbi:MAG: DUF1465 family protein [Candidatus Tokpelaia sp.]|nr:MAG: DUF1465 family protein [Candidatus Tokpelaia sp.]KAA6206330.1 MAG: DUF1465 family protein [Candidatus Tokpelaia sp.]